MTGKVLYEIPFCYEEKEGRVQHWLKWQSIQETTSFIPTNIFLLTQYSFLEASHITKPRASWFPLCSLPCQPWPQPCTILELTTSLLPSPSSVFGFCILFESSFWLKILEFLSTSDLPSLESRGLAKENQE